MFLKLLSSDGTLEPTADEIAHAEARATQARSMGIPGADHLEIRIEGRIDRDMYERVNAQLDAAPCAQSIELFIDSEGGECGSTIDLYIKLRRHPAAKKVARLLSRCESASVLIAVAADHRIATPDTKILLHPSSFELHNGDRWTAEELAEKANELRSVDDDFNTIMAQRTGTDVEIIARESTTEDFSPLSWCLVHGIIHEVQS